MTVLPESPVREYAERVEMLIAAKLNEPDVCELPPRYKYADTAVVWRGGVCNGLALARSIVVSEEPEPGQGTTYFEYRVAGSDAGIGPSTYSGWVDSYDKARSWRLDLQVACPPFDDLYIERRTVTVTQPVRLDDNGEPTT